jgi:ABC-2 type transport system permease protein
MLRRSRVIARHELRILRHDSFPVVMLAVTPLFGMVFMKSAFQPALVAEGLRHANGSEQAVPGIAVTFGTMLIGSVGYGFYREHAWKTWPRLRASPASTIEVVSGKIALPLLLAAVQFTLLFGVGTWLLDLHVLGSWLGLVMVGVAFSLALVALGLAVTAVCQTVMQANAFVYVGGLLLSCLGGALVPHSTLPGWGRALSPLAPHYWAMRGYQNAILDRGGGVAAPVTMLLLFAALFTAVAVWKLRFEDVKTGFAIG